MNIQDRKKTLTVEELRRRYNLDSLDKDRKAIKIAKEQLNKVDSELNNFVEITTKNIKELQDQVDGNITTWFFNGVPTLNNEPANSWTTDEDKINHLGDLYYDQDTGYAYRWAVESNIYSWSKIVDADVVEALAVANSAQDTADSKRRVFVTNPIPPYDIGDIWIKDDQDLYRCRASRKSGTMNIADWILATKYTDDTVALGTKAELDQFKTEVTKNYVTNATLETTASSISGRVEETYTYVTNVEHQVNDITTTTQTSIGGNNLYLEDALESNAIEYHVDGKSEQETSTQGKNLLNITDGKNETISGVTFTYQDDGSIILNGTSTKAIAHYNYLTNFKLPAGTYTHSTTNELVTGLYCSLNNTQETMLNALKKQTSWTLESETTYTNYLIYIGSGVTLNNYVITPQIEKGSSATTYEPFVPNSPSPDYPSEIKSIPSIRNLFDEKNYNYVPYSNVNSTGLIISNKDADLRCIYVKVKPNTTYTISANVSRNWVITTTSELPAIGVQGTTRIVTTSKIYTLTTGSTTQYLILRHDNSGMSETQNYLGVNLQIEEGSVAHDYVPYGAWVKVKITNEDETQEKEVLIDLNIYYEEGNITGHHELCSIGDTKDTLDIVNGQVVLNEYIEKIDSYNGETITTNYISTTGELTTGATVYYILAEPKQITLPNTQIPLFEGVNHISLVDDLETTTSIKYYRNTPIAQDYVVQQQLDETNSNLSNTDNKVSQAQSDINTTNTNLNNNYYNKNQIDVMNTSTEQVITQIKNSVEATTSATNLQISILQEQLKNGVTSVKTETGYTFDKDGLKIQKTGSEMSSLLDNDGLVVKRNETEVLTVRSSGVETENLKVRTYFTIGDNTRVENYKGGTGFFYIGGAS